MIDLKLALTTLEAKIARYSPYFAYYAGDQPLHYAAERLREIFQSRQTAFTQNWCAVVVNALLDRLQISQWSVGDDEQAAVRLLDLWRSTGLEGDAAAVHRSVALTGEGFVMVWPGEAGVEAYYHDPRICHVWYEAERPRIARLAAKWWRDDAGVWRLNLYYPERIEHYYAGGDGDAPPRAGAFRLVSDEANPLGAIPIVHFHRDRHLLQSELTNVIPMQDAINKLLGDMMIAAEYGAFRQRWIITNGDTSRLRNAPNEIWDLPAAGPGEQPTTLGEFATTDLGNYLNAIDRLASSIGVVTQTPRHYFYQQGGDPSGEALIAMEASLVHKVQQYQSGLGAAWCEVAARLLALDGALESDPRAITAVWEDAATLQPRTRAEIRQFNVAAGVPLTTILRDEGWTAADLMQMQADKDEEAAAQQTQLASALVRAQTQFDAGDGES